MYFYALAVADLLGLKVVARLRLHPTGIWEAGATEGRVQLSRFLGGTPGAGGTVWFVLCRYTTPINQPGLVDPGCLFPR